MAGRFLVPFGGGGSVIWVIPRRPRLIREAATAVLTR